ncbi:tRNA lysidine(34) synthetase TilS [Pelosinus sp. sgz500959]|uniref:tRNA lysidine(34) synthetase TilS n=1 Tax=Pelosinus sp. sgz500959 TaxID=3242472 RepID=UPI003672FFCD
MLTKVRAWITKYKMLSEGDKIVVACSGGPDSLALLHIFNEFRLEYNIDIFAAHVDHMFRGLESAKEAIFVVDFCKAHQIPCYHTAIDVPKVIKETGLSGSDAARVVRYQYLRQIAKKVGGAKIATGHHRDDQAETVLINILRGAGSTGIRGIQPINGDLIRPLLSVSRADISDYCQQEKLEPRFDSSNLKMNYLRNRIRINLLPELEKQYNIAIKDALCRTATLVGDEHDFIQMTARNIWDQIVTNQEENLFIDGKKMKNIHIAVRREIFRMAIEKKRGNLTGISFHHVETLLQMLSAGRVGSTVQLPGELVACKSYEGLYLGVNGFTQTDKADYQGQTLPVPGVTFIQELGIEIRTEVTEKEDSISKPNVAVFDWDKLSPTLFVRRRRAGDQFQPFGFHGSKKLKEFFIDEKIPRQLRDNVPIICDGHGIIWVGGYRQAEVGRVSAETKKFLIIKMIEMQ